MKILFISHDAFRAGAPILLINLANVLKSDFEIEFLLKDGGTLEPVFQETAKTYYFRKNFKSGTSGFFQNFRGKKKKAGTDIESIDFKKYDFILSNTITNGDILPYIRDRFKKPIISYIHELEMAAKFFTTKEHVKQMIRCSDFFAVPSNAVKDFLISSLRIDKDKIGILPYYIPPFSAEEAKTMSRKGKKEFIIGGAGTTDWRKGVDIFMQIAYRIKETAPALPIRFIWKGAREGVDYDRVCYDIKKSKLGEAVEIVMADGDMGSFFDKIDVFLLTSREDPFPLVVLEAANSYIPSITFDNSGGAQEFVEKNSGLVASYFSVSEAVGSIMSYYNDRILLRTHGVNAQKQLRDLYQNDQKIRQIFNDILQKLLKVH